MTPLHRFGELVRGVLLAVPPWAVRSLFLAVPLALLVWVLTLPRAETTPREGPGGIGGNLKLWAALALGVQVLIYLFL